MKVNQCQLESEARSFKDIAFLITQLLTIISRVRESSLAQPQNARINEPVVFGATSFRFNE